METKSGGQRRGYIPVLFGPLVLIALLTVIFVPPTAEFPLNDDWIYTKVVQKLVEDRRFEAHPFAASNMVGHAIIGAVSCLPSGFSFTALRISTLALALIGAWAIARCGRELELSAPWSVLCGAVMFWNPIVLNLDYTFMTDVPFMTFTALSGWFFIRALRRGANVDLLFASSFAAYAFLIRQFGILMPAAYLCAAAVQWKRDGRRPTLASLAILVAPWTVAGMLLVVWRSTSPDGYVWSQDLDTRWLPKAIPALASSLKFAIYLGLFVLPVAAARIGSLAMRLEPWSRAQRRWFVAFCILTFVFVCGFGRDPSSRMPFLTNMLYDLGVGPITLFQGWGASYAPRVAIGQWWWLVTLAGIAAAAFVVGDIGSRVVGPILSNLRSALHDAMTPLRLRALPMWKYVRENIRLLKRYTAAPEHLGRTPRISPPLPTAETTFLLAWGVLLIAGPYNPWVPVYFDRYLLPAVPPLLLLVASGLPRKRSLTTLAAAVAVLFYVFGVICLQDYFAWNGARWAAIDKLRHSYRVDDEHIEAGYEFWGMYQSDELMRRTNVRDFQHMPPIDRVFDIQYKVAIKPDDGYEAIDRVRYFSWLGMQSRDVLICRRQPQTER